MSGEPAGWKTALVRELGDVQLGRQRSPNAATGPNQTPYLRVANVFDGFIDYCDVFTMSFSEAERRVFGVQPGDILLNEGQSLELVGRSAIYNGSPGTYCIQNTLVRFRCGEELVPSFAQAMFKRWMDTGKFAQIAKQTTSIAHLGAGRFGALTMALPPVPEQRRITEVLGALDEAIRKTEQVIAKLQQMKQGFLNDLLTRGIDENGELRDPDRHPEQFKDSPLGQIPKHWEVALFGECLQGTPQNGLYKPSSFYGEDGAPIVRIDGFYDGVLAPIQALKRVRLAASEVRAYGLEAGNILINRVNSVDFVGKAALVPALNEPVVFESNMMRCRLRFDRVRPEYAIQWLTGPRARRWFRRCAKSAVAQASVNQSDVRALQIIIPNLQEQARTIELARDTELRISAETALHLKLRTLKHGLMDDLLTGRVRVTPEEPAR